MSALKSCPGEQRATNDQDACRPMKNDNMLTSLRLYLLTWNILGRPPIEDLSGALSLPQDGGSCEIDFYAIGLQEVDARPQAMFMGVIFEDPWCKALREILEKYDYVLAKTIRLRGLLLVFFTKRKHLVHLRGLQTEYTRTGLGGIWGNKGGVTVRFNVYGCSLCIVNCHLAAHEYGLKQRIEDYNSIIDSQLFDDPETKQILCHDYVFWIGDLNFRLTEHTAEDIQTMIDEGKFAELLEKDELTDMRRSGQAFEGFQERQPDFKPSYKYYVDTDKYDLRRKPGWTDRILYRYTADAYDNERLDLKQGTYTMHDSYIQSDHKPVSSTFTVKILQDFDEDRVIFSKMENWTMDKDGQCTYKWFSSTRPTAADWIGIFKANFSNLSDYVTYAWTNSSTEVEQQAEFRTTFHEVTLAPGDYCLLYMSGRFGNVLGMSETFKVLR